MAEDKGKEVKKEGAGPSSGPGGKKDYSTAILERKKSPTRLVVDDAVRAAPPRPPPPVPAGPEGPGSPPPRGRPRLGGSRAPPAGARAARALRPGALQPSGARHARPRAPAPPPEAGPAGDRQSD